MREPCVLIMSPRLDTRLANEGGLQMVAGETPDSDDQAVQASAAKTGWQQLYRTEDWWAVWIGGILLAICTVLVWQGVAAGEKGSSLLTAWLGKPGSWTSNPLDAFTVKGASVLPGVCGVFLLSLVAFGLGCG